MILYIVRHAIAEAQGVTDAERELTKEGIEKMEKAAAGLRSLGIAPELILTSPYVRARQTAEILVNMVSARPSLKETPALVPHGNRAELYREILKQDGIGEIMLVGHQPSLGKIAGEIAWGSAEHALDLKKGGACAIEIDKVTASPRGILLWFMPPAILRKLA